MSGITYQIWPYYVDDHNIRHFDFYYGEDDLRNHTAATLNMNTGTITYNRDSHRQNITLNQHIAEWTPLVGQKNLIDKIYHYLVEVDDMTDTERLQEIHFILDNH